MKIACVSTSMVPSTTANSIQMIKASHALVKLGHEVRLWVPGKPVINEEQIQAHYGITEAFPIHWIESRKVFKRYDFALSAWRQIEKWQVDLVYTWFIPLADWSLHRGRSVLLEMHDLPTGILGRRLFRDWVNTPGKRCTLFITQALREMTETAFGCRFAEEQVVIGPNGVDLDHYRDIPSPKAARQQLGLEERVTIVYSGHFYPGRGMDLLWNLALALPDYRFLWIGGNEERVTFWKERLQADGLDNVTLCGFVPNRELPLFQAAGDILLMPYEMAISGSSGGNSVKICSPMKMFDYLACGRAIITSDLPVLHEVLNDQNAVFCPPNDLEAWKAAILHLSQDAEKMASLASRSRIDAERYAWVERAARALKTFDDDKK